MEIIDKTELISEILAMQRKVGQRMHDDPPKAWLDLDLTIPQLKTLFYIRHKGTVNFKMLAEALGVTPPNVTGIVDRMVEHGLIKREENPENRRMQMLSLTAKADKILTDLQESGNARFTEVLMRLNMQDLMALAQGMRAIIKAVELKIISA